MRSCGERGWSDAGWARAQRLGARMLDGLVRRGWVVGCWMGSCAEVGVGCWMGSCAGVGGSDAGWARAQRLGGRMLDGLVPRAWVLGGWVGSHGERGARLSGPGDGGRQAAGPCDAGPPRARARRPICPLRHVAFTDHRSRDRKFLGRLRASPGPLRCFPCQSAPVPRAGIVCAPLVVNDRSLARRVLLHAMAARSGTAPHSAG